VHVHPVVEFGCATLDCHGDPGRPLRIFSSTGLRAGDARDAPLTDAEYAADVGSFAALAPVSLAVDLHPALSKPLAGGASHEGGDIWSSTSEHGYACLRGWLANDTSASVEAACAAAFDAYGVPPETP
jgi:hypothetical protein